MSQDPPSPVEAVLDLLVYLPVGLALTVTEELPKLAAKGRSRVGGQVTMARMLGQLAAGQGRKLLGGPFAPGSPDGPAERPAPRPTPGPRPPRPASAFTAATSGTAATGGTSGTAATGGTSGTGGPVGGPPAADAGAGPPRPSAGELAIPNYDSLSASQVVQRLAGLSGEELEAVRRYETGGRGRRTILSRVGQLQGG